MPACARGVASQTIDVDFPCMGLHSAHRPPDIPVTDNGCQPGASAFEAGGPAFDLEFEGAPSVTQRDRWAFDFSLRTPGRKAFGRF
jgi:hypothetical protein